MKIEKSNTLICTNIKSEKINDLLGEIFRKLTNFNIHNGYCPENILLTHEDYLRIEKERLDLISLKDNDKYILCMKIIVEDNRLFPKKIKFKDKLKLDSMFPRLKRK